MGKVMAQRRGRVLTGSMTGSARAATSVAQYGGTWSSWNIGPYRKKSLLSATPGDRGRESPCAPDRGEPDSGDFSGVLVDEWRRGGRLCVRAASVAANAAGGPEAEKQRQRSAHAGHQSSL
jgi:hypothetical protein